MDKGKEALPQIGQLLQKEAAGDITNYRQELIAQYATETGSPLDVAETVFDAAVQQGLIILPAQIGQADFNRIAGDIDSIWNRRNRGENLPGMAVDVAERFAPLLTAKLPTDPDPAKQTAMQAEFRNARSSAKLLLLNLQLSGDGWQENGAAKNNSLTFTDAAGSQQEIPLDKTKLIDAMGDIRPLDLSKSAVVLELVRSKIDLIDLGNGPIDLNAIKRDLAAYLAAQKAGGATETDEQLLFDLVHGAPPALMYLYNQVDRLTDAKRSELISDNSQPELARSARVLNILLGKRAEIERKATELKDNFDEGRQIALVERDLQAHAVDLGTIGDNETDDKFSVKAADFVKVENQVKRTLQASGLNDLTTKYGALSGPVADLAAQVVGLLDQPLDFNDEDYTHNSDGIINRFKQLAAVGILIEADKNGGEFRFNSGSAEKALRARLGAADITTTEITLDINYEINQFVAGMLDFPDFVKAIEMKLGGDDIITVKSLDDTTFKPQAADLMNSYLEKVAPRLYKNAGLDTARSGDTVEALIGKLGQKVAATMVVDMDDTATRDKYNELQSFDATTLKRLAERGVTNLRTPEIEELQQSQFHIVAERVPNPLNKRMDEIRDELTAATPTISTPEQLVAAHRDSLRYLRNAHRAAIKYREPAAAAEFEGHLQTLAKRIAEDMEILVGKNQATTGKLEAVRTFLARRGIRLNANVRDMAIVNDAVGEYVSGILEFEGKTFKAEEAIVKQALAEHFGEILNLADVDRVKYDFINGTLNQTYEKSPRHLTKRMKNAENKRVRERLAAGISNPENYPLNAGRPVADRQVIVELPAVATQNQVLEITGSTFTGEGKLGKLRLKTTDGVLRIDTLDDNITAEPQVSIAVVNELQKLAAKDVASISGKVRMQALVMPDLNGKTKTERDELVKKFNTEAMTVALLSHNEKNKFLAVPVLVERALKGGKKETVLAVRTLETEGIFENGRSLDTDVLLQGYLAIHEAELRHVTGDKGDGFRGTEAEALAAKQEAYGIVAETLINDAITDYDNAVLASDPDRAKKLKALRDIRTKLLDTTATGNVKDTLLPKSKRAFMFTEILRRAKDGGVVGAVDAKTVLGSVLASPTNYDSLLEKEYETLCAAEAGDQIIPKFDGKNSPLSSLSLLLTRQSLLEAGVPLEQLNIRGITEYYGGTGFTSAGHTPEANLIDLYEVVLAKKLVEGADLNAYAGGALNADAFTASAETKLAANFKTIINPDQKTRTNYSRAAVWEDRNILTFNKADFTNLNGAKTFLNKAELYLQKNNFTKNGGPEIPFFASIHAETLKTSAQSAAAEIKRLVYADALTRGDKKLTTDYAVTLQANEWAKRELNGTEFQKAVLEQLKPVELNGSSTQVWQELRDAAKKRGRDKLEEANKVMQQASGGQAYWNAARMEALPAVGAFTLDATFAVTSPTTLDYNHLGELPNGPKIKQDAGQLQMTMPQGQVVTLVTNGAAATAPALSTSRKGKVHPAINLEQLNGLTGVNRSNAIERINAQLADLVVNKFDDLGAHGARNGSRRSDEVFMIPVVVDATGTDPMRIEFRVCDPYPEEFKEVYVAEYNAAKNSAPAGIESFRGDVAKDVVDRLTRATNPQTIVQVVADLRVATKLAALDPANVVPDLTSPKGLKITAEKLRLDIFDSVINSGQLLRDADVLKVAEIQAAAPDKRKEKFIEQLKKANKILGALESGVGAAGYDAAKFGLMKQCAIDNLAGQYPVLLAAAVQDVRSGTGEELNLAQKIMLADAWLAQGLAGGFNAADIAEIKEGLYDDKVYNPNRWLNKNSALARGWHRLRGRMDASELRANVLKEQKQQERLYAIELVPQILAKFAGEDQPFSGTLDDAVAKIIAVEDKVTGVAKQLLTKESREATIKRLIKGEIVDYIQLTGDPNQQINDLLEWRKVQKKNAAQPPKEWGVLMKLRQITDAPGLLDVYDVKIAHRAARAVLEADPTLELDQLKTQVKAVLAANQGKYNLVSTTIPANNLDKVRAAIDALSSLDELRKPDVDQLIAEHGLSAKEVAEMRGREIKRVTDILKQGREARNKAAEMAAAHQMQVTDRLAGVNRRQEIEKAQEIRDEAKRQEQARQAANYGADRLANERVWEGQGWKFWTYRKVRMGDYRNIQAEKLSQERNEQKEFFENVLYKVVAHKLLNLDNTGTDINDIKDLIGDPTQYGDKTRLENALNAALGDRFLTAAEVTYMKDLVDPKKVTPAMAEAIAKKFENLDSIDFMRLGRTIYGDYRAVNSVNQTLGRLGSIMTERVQDDDLRKRLTDEVEKAAAAHVFELARATGRNDENSVKVAKAWLEKFDNYRDPAGNAIPIDPVRQQAILDNYLKHTEFGKPNFYKPLKDKLDLKWGIVNGERKPLRNEINKLFPPTPEDLRRSNLLLNALELIADRTLEGDVRRIDSKFGRATKFAVETGIMLIPGIGVAMRFGAREGARSVLEIWNERKKAREDGTLTWNKSLGLTAKFLGRSLLYMPARTAVGVSTMGMSELWINGASATVDVFRRRKELDRKDVALMLAAGVGSLALGGVVAGYAAQTVDAGNPMLKSLVRFGAQQVVNSGVFSAVDTYNNRVRFKDPAQAKERMLRQELTRKSRTIAAFGVGLGSFTNMVLHDPNFEQRVNDTVTNVTNAVRAGLGLPATDARTEVLAFHSDTVLHEIGVQANNFGNWAGPELQRLGNEIGNGINNVLAGLHITPPAIGPIGPIPGPFAPGAIFGPGGPLAGLGGPFAGGAAGGPGAVGAGGAAAGGGPVPAMPAIPAGASDWMSAGHSPDGHQVFINTHTADVVEDTAAGGLVTGLVSDGAGHMFAPAGTTFNPVNDPLAHGAGFAAVHSNALNAIDGDIDVVTVGGHTAIATPDATGNVVLRGADGVQYYPVDVNGNRITYGTYQVDAAIPGISASESRMAAFTMSGAGLDSDGDKIPDLLDPEIGKANVLTLVPGGAAGAAVPGAPVVPGAPAIPAGAGGVAGFNINPTHVHGAVNWTETRADHAESVVRNMWGDFNAMKAAIVADPNTPAAVRAMSDTEWLAIIGERATAMGRGGMAVTGLLDTPAELQSVMSNIASNGHTAAAIPTFVNDINNAFASAGVTPGAAGAAGVPGVGGAPGAIFPAGFMGNSFLLDGKPITNPDMLNLIGYGIAKGYNPGDPVQWQAYLSTLSPAEVAAIDGGAITVSPFITPVAPGGPAAPAAPSPIITGVNGVVAAFAGNAPVPSGASGFGAYVITEDPATGNKSFNFGLFGAKAIYDPVNNNYDLRIGIPLFPGLELEVAQNADYNFVNNLPVKTAGAIATAMGAYTIGLGALAVARLPFRAIRSLTRRVTGGTP
jgi:hypothetical protein